jgi:hypothetical protein
MLMEAINSASAAGITFDVMGAILALLLARTRPTEDAPNPLREHRLNQLSVVPHIFLGIGVVCFIFALSAFAWITQSTIMSVVMTVSLVMSTLPLIAFILIHMV